MQVNTRSFGANFDSLFDLCQKVNFLFDIIIATETWCDFGYAQLFQLPDYAAYTFPRPTVQQGGCICLFINNRFHQYQTSCSYTTVTSSFEHGELAVVNSNNGDCFVIAGVYRPPKCSLKQFLEEFSQYCDFLTNFCSVSNAKLVIAGDFNIDMISYNNCYVRTFMNDIYAIGLFPAIYLPTRCTNCSATLLDNFLVSNPNLISSGVIQYDLADHFPIFVVFADYKRVIGCFDSADKIILYCPLSDRCLTKLNEYLLTADRSLIINDSDINADYDYLSKTISSALNLIAPVKSLKCNRKTSEKAWLTSALIVSCCTKSKLYNDALNDPNKLNMYKT